LPLSKRREATGHHPDAFVKVSVTPKAVDVCLRHDSAIKLRDEFVFAIAVYFDGHFFAIWLNDLKIWLPHQVIVRLAVAKTGEGAFCRRYYIDPRASPFFREAISARKIEGGRGSLLPSPYTNPLAQFDGLVYGDGKSDPPAA
jgi:hypothetical protein